LQKLKLFDFKVPSSVLDEEGKFHATELMTFNCYKDEITWMSPEW